MNVIALKYRLPVFDLDHVILTGERWIENVKRTKARYYLLFSYINRRIKTQKIQSPDNAFALEDFVFLSHCMAGTAPNLIHY